MTPASSLITETELRADPLKLLEACESDDEARFIFARVPRVFWAYFLDLELEPFQEECILTAERNFRCLFEWPAGHGKSTNMDFGYPIWHIARNRNVRIINIGKTTEEMDAYGLLVRNTLEKSEKLRTWYGHFRDPDPGARRSQIWSQSGMNVFGRQIDDPHNTMEWFGSNSDAALGHRCDIIIIDDVVTPDTAGTPERRRKLEYRMREQWQTAPQYKFAITPQVTPYPVHDPISGAVRGYLRVPQGITWPTGFDYEKIIVCGTVFHYQDLYHTLETDPTFVFRRYDCFVEKGGQRESLWPGRWSLEALERERKSQGPLSFNRRYRNICMSEEDLSFAPNDLEAMWDPSRSCGDVPDGARLILSLDPASGTGSKYSAYPSWVLGAYLPSDPPDARRRYLIDCYRKHNMGFHEMLDQALAFHDLYHYDVWVVETNAFGSWLIDEREPKVRELLTRGVRILPHITTGQRKADPEWGVRSMETSIRAKLWSVPAASAHDRERWSSWREQMETHPQGYTDYPMATWFFDRMVRAGAQFYRPVKPGGEPIYHLARVTQRGSASKNDTGGDPGRDDFHERQVRP